MLANQSKNDTLYIKGFNIIVENRAFTYRQVAQNVGQKACLMPAHYGYLQNNPKVGVFVGAFPENDTVYLINQKVQGGYFDKHIAMFGFLSEQQAVDTYQKCFEYGYIGLMSVVPCTIEQLKWWLINGDKSRPVTKERLPYAGLERLDSVLWGGEDKADLASHSGQVAKLLYQIRQSDSFNHALEPLSYHDLTQELGNQGFVYENYDALVIEYNKLERKTKQMLMAMQGAADVVKPVGVAVSKPLTKGGVANVVAWFEMEDGQAVGVFFHNPDKTPKKIDPTDEMISYKWVLNKKDITIVVAPENGKDLVIRTVAKRIMKLVDANHDRFLKANSDKAELNLKEQNLGQLVIEKQAELDALNKAIEALEAQKAEREANKLKVPTGEELRQQGYNGVISELKKLGWTDDSVTGGLSKSFIGANEKGTINPNGILNVIVTAKDANMMATVGGDTIVSGSTVIIPQYGVTAQTEESYKKVADKINNAVEAYVAKQREEIQSSALKTTGKLSTPQELVQAAEPKQPESEPLMANPDRDLLDFALVTFSSWKKNGKHRIYLKLSEKDNAFNKMDYGVNDLGYLEIKGKDIKNLSTVSSYSPLSDRIIGDEFIVSFKKYLSEKDMNIADFSIKTLPVSIKSDAEVLTEKQAAINARTQAESQAAQAQQSKVDLQQATIKENIIKFGKDAVANDLSDAVLGNKAKVDAILGGALMSDKDFNSFLSYQASAKPIAAQNPDRDYLQSIIDGKDTGLEPKAITAKIRQIIVKAKDENDTEILVLADQAAKAYAAQVKAKAAAKLAEVQ